MKYRNNMSSTMPPINRIAQGNPPGARGAFLFLGRAGLNFAIYLRWYHRDSAAMPQSEQVEKARSFALVLAAALAGCRSSTPLPPNLFPENAAGGWHRTALVEPSLSDAPDPVPRTAVERLAVATYEGPGKLEARVYVLNSPAVGVDLAQRWRPSADTVFFYRGRYFVVVKWQSAERRALEDFVRELEGRLGPTNPRSMQPKRQTQDC
jgi:hypothetical protein